MSGRRQYPFHLIEPKWQQHWDDQQTFRAWNPGEVVPGNHPFAQRHGADAMAGGQAPAKYYILDMFPYPSGAGLHVGHPEGYTATDILARYQRAQGRHVLHPMGWDAFGLPAEQYAIKTGKHPRKTTEENITTFKRQIKSLGFSYDWSREVDTTDPHYFKWTQWIFLKLYNSWFNPETNKAESIEILEDVMSESPRRDWTKGEYGEYLSGLRNGYILTPPADRSKFKRKKIDAHRLAFVSEQPVWWCEQLGTVLANEEVVDGKSEVGGFPVVRKPMRQWMLRITAYAERLLQDLDTIDWTDSLKQMQRNWIGQSEGAHIEFEVDIPGSARYALPVFTTRPDTLFGATYIVLAPEHGLVEYILAEARPKHRVNNKIISDSVRIFSEKGSSVETLSLSEALRKAETNGVDLIEVNPNVNPPSCILGDYKRYIQYQQAVSQQAESISNYQKQVAKKSDLERTELSKEKTGVFTGAYATNPVTGQKIPIWIADYVLASYGTGAIMAVPAHDERDFEFAQKFSLPVVQVVQPPDPKTNWQGFVDDGTAVNSANAEFSLDGLPTQEAKKKITEWLEAKGLGKKTINYKLRDWLFSRQRYWGEPFPIIWKRDASGNLYHEALPDSALPLLPPKLDDYKPTPDGQPPLARAQDWVNLPDGSQRETNTMPQWAGSCWYYLRYLDSKNPNAFVSKEAENYWLGSRGRQSAPSQNAPTNVGGYETPGVDLYVGGAEHAVLHLLYARFWHKVLFDLGYVSTSEPFFKLVNQGIILGEAEYTRFTLENGTLVSAAKVRDITEENTQSGSRLIGVHTDTGEKVFGERIGADMVEVKGHRMVLRADEQIAVDARSSKMSKSRGNVVNPDDILKEYGADAFRLYEMFMGPLEMSKPWNTKGVEGVYRFLGRVWRLFVDEQSETEFEQAETTADAQKRGELLNILKLNSAIKDVPATPAQLKILHATIKKVTEDLDGLRFNTAISEMMVFVNDAIKWETKPVSVLREFLVLLAPFAPHVAEELWAKLNSTLDPRPSALSYAPWPKYDPALLIEDTLEIPVQVNGKLRDVIKAAANADNATLEAAAKASEKVQQFLEGKTIKKIIVVPKKLINIVAV